MQGKCLFQVVRGLIYIYIYIYIYKIPAQALFFHLMSYLSQAQACL